MNEIKIAKDETTGLWTISVDGVIKFECLGDDELTEVVRDLTSN